MFASRTARNVIWLAIVGLGFTLTPLHADASSKTVDAGIASASKGNTPISVLVRVAPSEQEAVAAAVATHGTHVEMQLPGALRLTIHPKQIDEMLAVLPGAGDQVAGYADVERASFPSCEEVDGWLFHGLPTNRSRVKCRSDSRLRGNDDSAS